MLKVFQNIVLIFFILILIFVVFSKYYLKNNIIKIAGKGFLIVVTGSMEPTIHIKEFIIISEQDNYKVNDIVTYKDYTGNLVTHRVIKVENSEIVTRGDNNTIDDNPISKESIEGKVIYHSVILGELFLYWIKPILILIASAFALNYIKDIFKHGKKPKINTES